VSEARGGGERHDVPGGAVAVPCAAHAGDQCRLEALTKIADEGR
jgi:hypothetical protein